MEHCGINDARHSDSTEAWQVYDWNGTRDETEKYMNGFEFNRPLQTQLVQGRRF